ncbi:hypothetical protein HOY82DRAFT_542999 [Tuber indicum]|nr:hypothetical protein HOY82DRAFT_542999 [Tuber indicum]
MATGANKQANTFHETPSQNLRSINIQDLWSHDQRHVKNTGNGGFSYCSPPLGTGRGSQGTSTSSTEDRTKGTNEVEVAIGGTVQSVTSAQGTGDSGCNSFLAIYHGLDWDESLAMLNWRLQEACAGKAESATITTGATTSPTVGPEVESVEKRVINPLELEPCYQFRYSDSSGYMKRGSEGNNSQQADVSVPALKNLASESASAAPPTGNIYHGLSWTDRLKMLNRNLQEAYEKTDIGNPNTPPTNTTRPQINFFAEDSPISSPLHPPGLQLFTPEIPPPPNFMTQQPPLGDQQQVYPAHDANWGPYPPFSQQNPQIPYHLFCPSAAHAISCGGFFVDPRAVTAIDHIVYNSAMLMFENFRRQFLAMEGKSNLGWWPVQDSGFDARGVTQTPTWAVNNPVASGDNLGRGEAKEGMNEEPHGEIDGGSGWEMRIGTEVEARPAVVAYDTTPMGIDTQPITPRLGMQDPGSQVDTELFQNQLSVTKTSTSSSQTDIIETPSTRDFGCQAYIPEPTIASSAQTAPTKTSSTGTSTNAKDPPAQIHSVPETQPPPPATKKYKYKRKSRAKRNTSDAVPPPRLPSPPPRPLFSTTTCESLSSSKQTITSITIEKVNEVPPAPIQAMQMQHTLTLKGITRTIHSIDPHSHGY